MGTRQTWGGHPAAGAVVELGCLLLLDSQKLAMKTFIVIKQDEEGGRGIMQNHSGMYQHAEGEVFISGEQAPRH